MRDPRAAVYGRLGTCVGRYGTLTTYLLDAVNLVAGNLDRPGGWVFGSLGRPGGRWGKDDGRRAATPYRNTVPDRGIPRRRKEPAALMAKEITTPGRRQIRAMFVSAGNPVLSVPNGEELERGLRVPGTVGGP